MKIGMLQLNFKVGDFEKNSQKIIDGYHNAVSKGAELVVVSELAVFGYPPKDMLFYEDYINAQNRSLEWLAKEIGDIGLVVGIAERNMGDGKPLFNSAALIQGWRKKPFVLHLVLHRKCLLPTYDVFDEYRYFEPNTENPVVILPYNGTRIAVLICEDIWGGNENNTGHKSYQREPVAELETWDPDILIVTNGSPYYLGKGNVRFDLVSGIARKLNCNVVYVNQVGGNDDLVFDGRSFVVNKNGDCIAAAQVFEEDVVIVDTAELKEDENFFFDSYPYDRGSKELEMKNLYQALVLGTRDYVRKNGFEKVVIGLSGGIDSALTACIAVDALGTENVVGVRMPSKYSSQGSLDDAELLAKNLGIELLTIPIQKIYDAYLDTLSEGNKKVAFCFRSPEITEENLQARARGNILMALSNKFGWLVLSTGNKSEISVGYCTLYGDMAGGYAVISDLWKTQVYKLADYVNKVSGGYRIPKNTIEKPPSAELRPDQKDTDSLPPYEYLDPILQKYVEEEKGIDEIYFDEVRGGKKLVKKVIDMVNRAEHKRKQMPIGPKTSRKAYGSGRRWPIAAKNL